MIQATSDDPLVVREIRRAYGEATVRTRLHQAYFRRDVLKVYKGRCSVCEMRIRPLLQGAHIVPDAAAEGVAAVQNGLALCTLHHTAYDRNVLRISPDYEIRIAGQWVEKHDAFAQVALVDFHGRRLTLPRDSTHYPNRDFLAVRYDK